VNVPGFDGIVVSPSRKAPNMNTKNVIQLPTNSQRALWMHEISGQLSDGMWENARPFDHWKFWCELEVISGAPHVFSNGHCKKTGYNLTSLLEYVGDRMVKLGRLAMCTDDIEHIRYAAEYMPETFTEWLVCKMTGKWPHDYVRDAMYLITEDVARKYYTATYTEKHLRADLKVIKQAMKTAKRGF
jgi:hypothetical protein